MMRSLQGKTAWITGAGTGIGEAGARALAAAGMHVVLSGRRIEPLNAVAKDLGDAASVEVLDVSDRNAVAAVAGRILDRHGSVDVLVNSAGINVKSRNWHNVSLDDWERIIRIDLDGAFYCIKTVLPAMIEQGDGLIINVSSWAGRHVSVVTGPGYTAAKHAMNAMNESVNMEHGIHGIRACAICPGEVATPILDNRPVPVTKEDRARMVQSEDCGDVIRFVAELPAHVCINELVISPTWNRGYIAQARTLAP
ncbi:MAG: SDR family oxidoreductase [Pseudomonadales bacterium]